MRGMRGQRGGTGSGAAFLLRLRHHVLRAMLDRPAAAPQKGSELVGGYTREGEPVDCEEGARRLVAAGGRGFVLEAVFPGRAHFVVWCDLFARCLLDTVLTAVRRQSTGQ